VTSAGNVPTILRDGFEAGDGICGRGVYLWVDRQMAEESVDDFGFEEPVILEIHLAEGETLARCSARDIAGEGDADYYEHVRVKRIGPGQRWRPASVRPVRGSRAKVSRARFGPSLDTPTKLRLARAAAQVMYEQDPEHHEGGCGDVSRDVKAFLDALGVPGVEIEAGHAESKRGRGAVWHAWLRVDGEIVDPTWELVLGRKGIGYNVDMPVFGMLSECDLPMTRSNTESVHKRLREAGWELPDLPRRTPEETW
jgi:hypothetical protein